MYQHLFRKIAERFFAWELQLSDDSAGGLIEKLRSVMPEQMPDNEVLVYQWLPPRKDAQGKPMEVNRLRLFRCPIGTKGPQISAITRVLNEAEIPEEVKMPEKLDVPAEIEALKEEGDREVVAARMNITFPRGSDAKLQKVLLARAAVGTPIGRDVLQSLRKVAPQPVTA